MTKPAWAEIECQNPKGHAWLLRTGCLKKHKSALRFKPRRAFQDVGFNIALRDDFCAKCKTGKKLMEDMG